MFKIVLVVALLAAVGGGAYLYAHMADEIRQHVESVLAERFPQLKVSVGGARLIAERGIAVYDIEFSLPGAARDEGRLLHVDELLLACHPKVTQLVQGNLEVKRIEVKHPQAWLSRSSTGTWNIATLFPLPPYKNSLPPIVVRDGWLSVSDEANPGAEPLVIRDLNATAAVDPTAEDPQRGVAMRIDGTAGGPLVDRVEFRATLFPLAHEIGATAKVGGVHVNETLIAWLQPRMSPATRGAKVRGELSGTVSVSLVAERWREAVVAADLHWTAGRISDPRLPRPLTEATARLTADAARLRIEDFKAKCGPSDVSLSLVRQGWHVSSPIAMAGRVAGMPLDAELYRVLPPFLQDQWDQFQPTGLVHGELQARFDGAQWRPESAHLRGEQLAFSSDKFRYRLRNGSGTLKFTPAAAEQPARLAIDMIGHGGGQPLRIVGEVIDPRPGAIGRVTISGRDVGIETAMIDALPDKPREVIGSLHPQGRFHFEWTLERRALGQDKPDTALRLELVDVAVLYDRFKYPLGHVSGLITAQNDHWRFTNLVSAERRTVRGQGRLDPVPSGAELVLQFTAEQAPLDDDLYDALPKAVQQAWTELRPRGHVDLVADVYYRTDLANPSVRATIYPRPETTLLRPTFFDYLMERVSGAITYHDGEVTLAGVRAVHDRTSMSADGRGFFGPDGRWHMTLTGLTADRVVLRQDLLVALPRQLSRLLEQLRPRGSFGIHDGMLAFNKPASPLAPLETRWDVQLECHEASLQCGVDLSNIFGMVRLEGRHDGLRAVSAGELNLDSVVFQDVMFTNVRSPFWVDEQQCLLGRHAIDLQKRQGPRRLTANMFDGSLALDAQIRYDGPVPQYFTEIDFSGVSLERLVAERFGGSREFRGKIDGNVLLRGAGRSEHALGGEGNIHIREAQLYELPLLASLLQRVRTGGRDSTAFNQSDIRFKLENQTIYLDQLDFLGDVVNLYGVGYTGFDQKLNLKFHGVVGRHDFHLPLVKQFVGQASQQIMQMNVAGTFSNPVVTTEALPGLSQMVQQIGTTLRGEQSPPLQATRPQPMTPQ
ncbi:MAG: hypothetical protein KF847_12645 [Pirellulales bacterium]|nr:hypothetical protein [Pirellulales bacterium]